jgi:hypothetical protein
MVSSPASSRNLKQWFLIWIPVEIQPNVFRGSGSGGEGKVVLGQCQ